MINFASVMLKKISQVPNITCCLSSVINYQTDNTNVCWHWTKVVIWRSHDRVFLNSRYDLYSDLYMFTMLCQVVKIN